MDSGSSHSGAACDHAFREITNIEDRKSSPQFKGPSLTGTSFENDRKRRRSFYSGPVYHDRSKNEVIDSSKALEACEDAKNKILSFTKPKSYDSESFNGNDESQSDWPVNSLSLRSTCSGQISRLSNDADSSRIGHMPRPKSETHDISTEPAELKKNLELCVEQFSRDPFHLIKDHKRPAFSDHTGLDFSLICKNETDVGDRLAHEKSEFISLCGSYPCFSCSKAAYMWSDLIYQDTRGRLSALKTSRRHAKILEGKILKQEKTVETCQHQLKKPRSTESDLLQHWTSLLFRTEDSLLSEIMQTQARLIEIEKLKDKFKTDLEKMNSRH